MEFRLDDGQVELQQTVARFCADRFPLDAVAAREGAPLDRSVWSELAGLGVLGLLLPEEAGGVGLGAVDAAIVLEQLGSHLAPGPVLWTLLAAPLVDGAAGGEQVVTGAEAAAVVDATVVVEHAADADVILVLGEDGVVAHRTSDLEPPTPMDAVDPLTTVGRFTALGDGVEVGDRDAASHLRTLGTVLSAALLAGVAARALEVARVHALDRHQFGAPIGSFQAVKHLLADMYVNATSAQSATYAAAAVLDDPGGAEPTRDAAGAKLLAADAAIANAGTAIQVLGGMGFTWDMLPNFLLKRAWALEHDFGAIEDHELLLGSTVEVVGS